MKAKREDLKTLSQKLENLEAKRENQKNKDHQTKVLITSHSKDLERLKADQIRIKEDILNGQNQQSKLTSEWDQIQKSLKQMQSQKLDLEKRMESFQSVRDRIENVFKHSQKAQEEKRSLEMKKFTNLKDQETARQEARILTERIHLSKGKKDEILSNRKTLENSIKKAEFRISEISKELGIQKEEKLEIESQLQQTKQAFLEKKSKEKASHSKLEEYKNSKNPY